MHAVAYLHAADTQLRLRRHLCLQSRLYARGRVSDTRQTRSNVSDVSYVCSRVSMHATAYLTRDRHAAAFDASYVCGRVPFKT